MLELTEFQTYDGEVLGRLYFDPDEKLWIFMDLDVEYVTRYDVKCFTKLDDQILINCYNGSSFWF